MREVHLTMTDLNSSKTVYRSIDITNAMSSGGECWELRGVEDQRSDLESWIAERGNDQHSTSQHKANLRLDSWTIS
jgi:hypothetical protein